MAVQLDNEGIFHKDVFMSINETYATIFESRHRIDKVFLVGTPVEGKDVFTWETGMIIDGFVEVANGAVSEIMMSLLVNQN